MLTLPFCTDNKSKAPISNPTERRYLWSYLDDKDLKKKYGKTQKQI